jgi:hypothetical protein
VRLSLTKETNDGDTTIRFVEHSAAALLMVVPLLRGTQASRKAAGHYVGVHRNKRRPSQVIQNHHKNKKQAKEEDSHGLRRYRIANIYAAPGGSTHYHTCNSIMSTQSSVQASHSLDISTRGKSCERPSPPPYLVRHREPRMPTPAEKPFTLGSRNVAIFDLMTDWSSHRLQYRVKTNRKQSYISFCCDGPHALLCTGYRQL